MRRAIKWIFILGVYCYLPGVYAENASPVGLWTTIDEVTGEKGADVLVELVNGDELAGTIVRTYSGDPGNCIACPGEFKDKPIQGLRFIWGLKKDSTGVWDAGVVLNPQNGKMYHLKMVREGEKLRVRGYLGISLLGRTQFWEKAT